jgi:NAD(P)H-nitrite reductase large subunit
LIDENGKLEKENNMLKQKIAMTVQKIDINNLLKEIDIEELQMQAKNNKVMNVTLENLITKWNYILQSHKSDLALSDEL